MLGGKGVSPTEFLLVMQLLKVHSLCQKKKVGSCQSLVCHVLILVTLVPGEPKCVCLCMQTRLLEGTASMAKTGLALMHLAVKKLGNDLPSSQKLFLVALLGLARSSSFKFFF